MLRAALAGLLIMMPGCQTIKVQGVEITEEQQFVTAVVAVAGAVLIAKLADGDDDDATGKCAQFANVPTGKGDNICAEDWWGD